MTLAHYLKKFRTLRQHSGAEWPPATRGRAPHKPLLLLAILDQIEEGTLLNNFVQATPELGELFLIYWYLLVPSDRTVRLHYPFYHLQSSGFWHLREKPGKEAALGSGRSPSSLSDLQRRITGAYFDEELWELLRDPRYRDNFRWALIESCFAEDVRPMLLNQSALNREAYTYSQDLIHYARQKTTLERFPTPDPRLPVRDQGFRRAIVSAYDHSCAMCGLRMRTPEGRTAVAAAHIHPWSLSFNDHPRNGLALCHLCHWGFDQGLLGVNPRYQVQTSPYLEHQQNYAPHILELKDKSLTLPREEYLRPSVKLLTWHMREIFRPG